MDATATPSENDDVTNEMVRQSGCGRSTYYNPATRVLSVEVSRYCGNRPGIDRIVSVYVDERTGDLMFKKESLVEIEKDMSLGGNGKIKFQLDESSLAYHAFDIAEASSRKTSFIFCIKDGEMSILSGKSVVDIVAGAGAADLRAASTARKEEVKLEQAAREAAEQERERARVAKMTAESELKKEKRAEMEVEIEARLDAFARDVATRQAEPIGGTTVEVVFNRDRASKNFAKSLLEMSFVYAPNLENFVEYRAGGIVADSRAALIALLAAKSNLGSDLVALTGSPKQIAWAEKIRARVMTRMPPADFAKIAKKAKAKFWIDNYK